MPITAPGDPPINPKHRWVTPVIIAIFLVLMATPYMVSRIHNAEIQDNQNAVIDALFEYRKLQDAHFKAKGHYAASFQDLGDPEWAKMTDAAAEKPTVFRGYYFKTFAAQAENAEGGAKKFFDKEGKMTGGYALMAIPIHYGFGGRLTFFLSSAGEQQIHYADLGVKTDTNVRIVADYFVPPGAGVLKEK